MGNPFVSVIVPVYKVERYLPRCIESILAQTYTNFELILVDDGTPDRSGIICDRYAEKDSRIKVIHKENGGVSSARNAGIDIAQGEWITFIDSDDWVSTKYLEVLVTPTLEHKYDLIVCKKENRGIVLDATEDDPKDVFTNEIKNAENIKQFDAIEYLGPWAKLFNKNIIFEKQLRFPVGIAIAEDAIFVVTYLQNCQRIMATGKVLYCYNCLNTGAVTHRPTFFEKRVFWDLKYLHEYSRMLDHFGVDFEVKGSVMYKKAVLGFRTVSRTITFNFHEALAKTKIADLFNHYDLWLSAERKDADLLLESAEHKQLAIHICNRNVDAIYDLLKPEKHNHLIYAIKRIIKKIVCPLIEKHRDGLIKFNFKKVIR